MRTSHTVIIFHFIALLISIWMAGCAEDDRATNTESQSQSTTQAAILTPIDDDQSIAARPRLPKGIIFFEAEAFDVGRSTLESCQTGI